MKIFLNISATRTYYLTQDTDKTIAWELGAIESLLMMHLLEKYKGVQQNEHGVALMREVLRFGLKGVKGQMDGQDIVLEFDDVEIPYLGKYRAVSDKFLNNLNLVVLAELATEVMNDNLVKDAERGNS